MIRKYCIIGGAMDTQSPLNPDEIKKLIKKAEQTRHAHFMICSRYKKLGKLIHAFILIGASSVAIFTFANYETFKVVIPNLSENMFTWIVGTIASIVFILTVLEEYIRWTDTARKHEFAGKILTTFIRECDGVIKQTNLSIIQIENLRTRYTQINESIPPIEDKYFIKAKQEYLIKVCISKELDNNPFLDIKAFKKSKRKGKGGQL